MPPEMKKPITSMNEMTCENCVFGITPQDEIDGVEFRCMHSDTWTPSKDWFCDKGQWLWLGTWDLIMDDKPKLHLFRLDELYEMFARHAAWQRGEE